MYFRFNWGWHVENVPHCAYLYPNLSAMNYGIVQFFSALTDIDTGRPCQFSTQCDNEPTSFGEFSACILSILEHWIQLNHTFLVSIAGLARHYLEIEHNYNSISPKAQDITFMLRIINSLHISAHFLIFHSHAEWNECECELDSLYKLYTNWTLNQIYIIRWMVN